MSAAPKINILREGESIRSVTIDSTAVAGRSQDCVIRLEDRAISREHAVFKRVGDQVQVERKSDFAPLIVNGEECHQALLKEGDIVSIGPYLLKLAAAEAELGRAETDLPVVAPMSPQVETPSFDLAQSSLEEESPSIEFQQASDGPVLEAPFARSADLQNSGMGLDLNQMLEPPPDVVPDAVKDSYFGDENAETKVAAKSDIKARLVFEKGSANVRELELGQKAVTIGRGRDCDVILEDKKSSRKNTVIERSGAGFVVRDLGSSNGTYVNNERIQEKELSGEDRIRIGETEIRFQAISQSYVDQEKDFMPVSVAGVEAQEIPELDPPGLPPVEPRPLNQPVELATGAEYGRGNTGQILGLSTGTPGLMPSGPKSLVEKFRALPRPRQILVGSVLLGLIYFAFFDEDPPAVKPSSSQTPQAKVVTPAGAVSGANSQGQKTFDSLNPDQKRFVESQHVLAFDHYKNRDYDKALFEIGKIFLLVPDYKDSREIERYSKEGKRKLEALEEERRHREEEARIKARVADLVQETQRLMTRKNYEQARALFSEIITVEPDNAQVAEWTREIEEWEERQKIAEQERQVRREVLRHAQEIFAQGASLKKRGQLRSAISAFAKVQQVAPTASQLVAKARAMIAECREGIASMRDPLLAEAKQAEQNGEMPKAFQLYKKVSVVDPDHPESLSGMDRIRGALHERAKSLYTEAVLAESYSDFAVAKKKYKECLETAPEDDIYHERSQRKLSRFFRHPEASE